MNMHVWQMQEAKARLSEVIKLSEKAPQIISLRGIEKVVVLDIGLYHRLIHSEGSLLDFFKESPLYGLSLKVERDKSLPRNVEL
jgi:prevent-host-death family protein